LLRAWINGKQPSLWIDPDRRLGLFFSEQNGKNFLTLTSDSKYIFCCVEGVWIRVRSHPIDHPAITEISGIGTIY
jgi:hypothetical protein